MSQQQVQATNMCSLGVPKMSQIRSLFLVKSGNVLHNEKKLYLKLMPLFFLRQPLSRKPVEKVRQALAEYDMGCPLVITLN